MDYGFFDCFSIWKLDNLNSVLVLNSNMHINIFAIFVIQLYHNKERIYIFVVYMKLKYTSNKMDDP